MFVYYQFVNRFLGIEKSVSLFYLPRGRGIAQT